MATPQLTFDAVYKSNLLWLREHGLAAIAFEIEKTSTRGVVHSERSKSPSTDSKLLLDMAAGETLAVALEYLVTFLEVPLMLEVAKKTLNYETIAWLPTTPGNEDERALLDDALRVDADGLRAKLERLVTITQELGLTYPEVS